MELVVSFGAIETTRVVKVQFLVIDCPSIYHCILGRSTLAKLIVVPFTVNLKMKYYTTKGQVATLHGDIEATRRCFKASTKGLNSIKVIPRLEAKVTLLTNSEAPKPMPRIDTIDLDSRCCRESVERAETNKSPTIKIEDILRPILYGDSELVPLDEDPTKRVKIGADLPELAIKQLKACLWENADLFSKNTPEMPGLDPEVACYHLTIDPACKIAAKRRRK